MTDSEQKLDPLVAPGAVAMKDMILSRHGDIESATAHPTDLGQLPRAQTALLDFIDPVALKASMDAEGWDFTSEIAMYVDIARNSVKDGNRITAAKQLRQIMLDALRMSGQLAQVTARMSQGADGRPEVEMVSVQQIVSKVQGSEALLQRMKGGLGATKVRALPNLGAEGVTDEQEGPDDGRRDGADSDADQSDAGSGGVERIGELGVRGEPQSRPDAEATEPASTEGAESRGTAAGGGLAFDAPQRIVEFASAPDPDAD